eukprot:jgi/Tetstr1/452101/TSEL_039137.t1
MLFGLLQFIDVVLNLIIFIIIAQVIVSWLLAFNILNMSNQFVATIANMLWQLTNPLLAPIRRLLPNFGGLDISPIVLFLAIYFIRLVILYPLMRQVAMQGLCALAVRVCAPPDKGAANKAVIALLAKALSLPKSALTLSSGQTSRTKVILARGNPATLCAMLESLADQ